MGGTRRCCRHGVALFVTALWSSWGFCRRLRRFGPVVTLGVASGEEGAVQTWVDPEGEALREMCALAKMDMGFGYWLA